MSATVSPSIGAKGLGVAPAASSTSQAAVTLTEYWPTLNSTFHSGLRCSNSERIAEPVMSTSAGPRPQTYMAAKTKASEMETGFPSSRLITTGRSSLRTMIATIMAKGAPMAVREFESCATTEVRTRAQPTHVLNCHVIANMLGRHSDGRA